MDPRLKVAAELKTLARIAAKTDEKELAGKVAARGPLDEAMEALQRAKSATFSHLEAMAKAGEGHPRSREYQAHQSIAAYLDQAMTFVAKATQLKKRF
jgi:hypothetical protein